MPIVRIEMLEGRPPEMKRELAARVTAAVADALEIDAARVRVLLYDVPPDAWYVGGEPSPGLRSEGSG